MAAGVLTTQLVLVQVSFLRPSLFTCAQPTLAAITFKNATRTLQNGRSSATTDYHSLPIYASGLELTATKKQRGFCMVLSH